MVIKATLKELDKVAALFDKYRVFYGKPSDYEAGKAFLKERLEKEESVIYLALDKDESMTAIGFVQLYPIFSSVGLKRQWLLNDLYVDKRSRRQGIGEKLLSKAKELSYQSGSAGILLETAEDNISAQQLYEKVGYKKDIEHFYYFLTT
ncbi:GNAT family N-acetyltransferase [Pseudalkalibacillus salsuginis]|uniref:GNAT family N-acetyltransferase n=1 Tax=Pseudalkalibacillus salsuginis TaxID=2910972 RepID=UPI001F229A4D|nr:GNAT family N-acetyltransferase [Pseudalkalibacillus salsuginis]MCF6411710.1 GNAT family N-acetyltransferase [Pseudalkalibacillus salsuginis]